VGRRLCLALVLGACGFDIPAPGSPASDAAGDAAQPGDGAPGDAADAPRDAPHDTPPAWTDVETRAIPCSGADVTSTTVLSAGVTYRLRGSGTCTVNNSNNSQGDPEWHYFNLGTPRDTEAGVDNGIAIDDATPGARKLPAWGAYSPSHSYTVDWLGTGTPITARYHDSNYSNNGGSLTLTIQAFQ
jgi:hypothetical protein